MRRLNSIAMFVTLVALVLACGSSVFASDLATYCSAWKDFCDRPNFECPAPGSTSGDYGIAVEIDLGTPGWEINDGGQYRITNNNDLPGTEIWVTVEAFGISAGKNLLFKVGCPNGSTCQCTGCPEGTGQCMNSCPGPSGTLDNCDFITDCDFCGCELGDATINLDPSETHGSQPCNYPSCPEPNCDNDLPCQGPRCGSSTSWPSLCSKLEPPLSQGGANFEVTHVSFDNVCQLRLSPSLSLPNDHVSFTTEYAICLP